MCYAKDLKLLLSIESNMKKSFFVLLLILSINMTHATPSLSGFSMIMDKPSYVLGEQINVMVNVYFAPGAPVYNAHANISFITPKNQTATVKNCTTDETGICYISYILSGNQSTGDWKISGVIETEEFQANSTGLFEVREMICGDTICDAGELGFCEQDCGKPNNEQCNQSSECNSEICCHNTCRDSCPFCGDSVCDASEDCSCQDCGECIYENEEEALSQGSGFSTGKISMNLTIMENNVTVQNNQIFEIHCKVENLENSTIENATLMISGINSTMFSIFPENADISNKKIFTIFISIPSNFYEGNYSARIIAVKNDIFSNPETFYFKVTESKNTAIGLMSCHGETRDSCPFCGDSYCDSGENCAICPNDCGECTADRIIGNKTDAERILKLAKEKSEISSIILFRNKFESANEYISQAEEFYIQMNYLDCVKFSSRAISLIDSIVRNQWIILIGSVIFIAITVVFFNKFFNSR